MDSAVIGTSIACSALLEINPEEDAMEMTFIVPVLALITMLAVIVFALWSKHKTEERRQDGSAPKSALAADGPTRTHEQRSVD